MKASNYYKEFVNQRDLALERILKNTRMQIADISRGVFLFLTHHYLSDTRFSSLTHVIDEASMQIAQAIEDMRRKSYLLTVTSQAEILRRIGATQKDVLHVASTPQDILDDELEAGGNPYQRAKYYFGKIIRKLDNMRDLRSLKGEKLTPDDIKQCLPRPRINLAPRTALKRIREAARDDKPKEPMVVDFVTDDQWDDILDDYKNDYVHQYRGPDTVFEDKLLKKRGMEPSERYEDVTYSYEIENDITHDFVQTVRLGENEAAQKMGVTDLIWIAVLDNRTDSCCSKRDGKTTQEIEDMINSGELNDEAYCEQADSPISCPLHFGCRCRLSPALDDLPDVPASNVLEFEDWLES